MNSSDAGTTRRRRFDELVGVFHQDMFRYAAWLCRDVGIAEEVVQEALLRAWKSLDALRDEFIATRETATRFEKTIAESSGDTILGKLAQDESQALSRIEDFIRPEQITDTAQLLMRARRILIYGYGNAEVLSVMMVKRFRRFGKEAVQLEPDPRALAEQMLGLSEGDVILSFAFRRPPRGYAALIETAREAGATTIIISGQTGALLAPQPDHLLTAPRSGDPDAFQTLTVPMTVCNAIVIAAGHTAKEESLKKLERLGQLIERFE